MSWDWTWTGRVEHVLPLHWEKILLGVASSMAGERQCAWDRTLWRQPNLHHCTICAGGVAGCLRLLEDGKVGVWFFPSAAPGLSPHFPVAGTICLLSPSLLLSFLGFCPACGSSSLGGRGWFVGPGLRYELALPLHFGARMVVVSFSMPLHPYVQEGAKPLISPNESLGWAYSKIKELNPVGSPRCAHKSFLCFHK